MGVEFSSKQFGLLHELLPRAAMLVNTSGALAPSMTRVAEAAAQAIGRPIEILTASTSRDIDAVFANMAQKRIEGLLVAPSALFIVRRVQITTLATRRAVPTIYNIREFVEAGGLMSYGRSFADEYRQLGVYTGRILKGEKPADLPVMQPTKFEFVINLQTARALDIDVPPLLLARADEVIECP
jgi:putative ABC transport system substrate-binding protein